MRLLTWNINGIRATNKTSSMGSLLDLLEADIICLQETKITRCLLPEDIANVDGYLAFFSFSRKKGGYSGVVTYCKKSFCPIAVEEGLSGVLTKDNEYCIGHHVTNEFCNETILLLDGEGRAIITEHKIDNKKHICIVNVYCPRADVENKERYTYKMNFYQLLEARCKSMIKAGKDVIIVGDLNVSHRRIDHCDPAENFEKNMARNWLNGMLSLCTSTTEQDNDEAHQNNQEDHDNSDGINSDIKTDIFLDVFRMFFPTEKNAFTCWNTMKRSRITNYGTRIDYILANSELSTYFTDCRIRPDILGSDHCPVQCDINVVVIPSKIVPDLCAIFMPELSGKQIGITSYFTTKHSDYGDLSVPQKRANDFDQYSTSKTRKVSNKKESKNSMLNYFKSRSQCKTVKSNTEECAKTCKSLVGEVVKSTNDSEEIWNSANYVSKSKPQKKNSTAKASWKTILTGPEPAPLCIGHKEKSVLRNVKKEGPNIGRQFYACNRPAGHSSNKEASCEFFQWKK